MQKIKTVKTKELVTLEDYLISLITSAASLKTLGAYQDKALKLGILEDDEAKVAEVILANLKAILIVYQTQVDNALDRTNLTEQEIIDRVWQVMPDIEIPRKLKNAKNKKESGTS